MTRSKGRIPFTKAWKTKYRVKIDKGNMDDITLLDKEVKHRRTLYQLSISAGFYIGLHTAIALSTTGATFPITAVQLSWQAYQGVQASFKHKMVLEEIYARGLEPREMTKAEMGKTALWSSLAVALGQTIDLFGCGVDTGPGHSMQDMLSSPGSTASSVGAVGGTAALSVVMDMLATGTLAAGAGLAVVEGKKALQNSAWAQDRLRSINMTRSSANDSRSGLSVKTTCSFCKSTFHVPLTSQMSRTCGSCQMSELAKRNMQRKQQIDIETEEPIDDAATLVNEEALMMLHLDTFCDGCCNAITGDLFHCMDCEDYDLCEDCHDQSNSVRMHTKSHNFERITPIDGKETKILYLQYGLSEHKEIYCDGCSRDIEGIRAQCTVCPYFDLCQECYSGFAGTQHPHNHSFHFVP